MLKYSEFKMTNHQKSIEKFRLAKFCRLKMTKAGILTANGRSIKLCKHIELFNTYREHFNTEPRDDFNKYLEVKSDKSKGYVYVVGNINAKICKIGFSTNVFKRISGIQTGCPIPLEIICVVHGTIEIEKKLHKKYKDFRMNGEWFRYEGLLKSNIESTESAIVDLMLMRKKKKNRAVEDNISMQEKDLLKITP